MSALREQLTLSSSSSSPQSQQQHHHHVHEQLQSSPSSSISSAAASAATAAGTSNTMNNNNSSPATSQGQGQGTSITQQQQQSRIWHTPRVAQRKAQFRILPRNEKISRLATHSCCKVMCVWQCGHAIALCFHEMSSYETGRTLGSRGGIVWNLASFVGFCFLRFV
jgi:hypothetical protein